MIDHMEYEVEIYEFRLNEQIKPNAVGLRFTDPAAANRAFAALTHLIGIEFALLRSVAVMRDGDRARAVQRQWNYGEKPLPLDEQVIVTG